MFTLRKYHRLIYKLFRQRTKDRKKLNKEQRLSIDLYFGNLHTGIKRGYGPIINYSLYGDGDSEEIIHGCTVSEIVKNLDYCIKNSNIVYDKDLFRGIYGDSSFLDYKIGDNIEFTSFLSTSFLPFLPLVYSYMGENIGHGNRCCLLVLKNYKGKVLYKKSEDEILLPRNTIWKLVKTSVKKIDKHFEGISHPEHGEYPELIGMGDNLKIMELEYVDL
jgi:hypothetical protein